VNDTSFRPRFIRLLIGNALALSATYLGLAVFFDVLRRFADIRWAERAALAMEALPARVLSWLGVLSPLRELYVYGRINEVLLRLIFGATTVAIIFLMAMAVGLTLGALKRLAHR
jgi:hypothetical protein